MMMKRLAVIAAIAIVGLAAYIFFWPVPISPIAWTPSPNPGQTGVFAQSAGFRSPRKLIAEAGLGPEDVTRGADGLFYTGLQDGRILRFRAEGDGRPELFVNTGGRPLGMQFDAHGNLIVADAFKGLLSISPDRAITILTDSVAGKRMLCPDDAFVLVNETIAARILRLWLKGPKAGATEVFINSLPAYPDNLSYSGKGIFWVALPAPRVELLEGIAGRPFLRK